MKLVVVICFISVARLFQLLLWFDVIVYDWESLSTALLTQVVCQSFHVMPVQCASVRYSANCLYCFCLDNGKEILSMNEVLNFLLRSSRPLLEETELATMLTFDENEWQNMVDEVRGMIVTYPGMV